MKELDFSSGRRSPSQKFIPIPSILDLLSYRSTIWNKQIYNSFPAFPFAAPFVIFDLELEAEPLMMRFTGHAKRFPRGWPASSEVRYSTIAMTLSLVSISIYYQKIT